jgi:hypothetical protein
MISAKFDRVIEAWRVHLRAHPAIDLGQRITPFATIGDLAGHRLPPSVWRPFARRHWFQRLENRVTRELEAQRSFAVQISAYEARPIDAVDAARAARKEGVS